MERSSARPVFPFGKRSGARELNGFFKQRAAPRNRSECMAAIVAHGDRTPGLRNNLALVIHGAADPLVPLAEEKRDGGSIRAELLVIEGMGHDVPEIPGRRLFPLSANSPQGLVKPLDLQRVRQLLPGVGAPLLPPRRRLPASRVAAVIRSGPEGAEVLLIRRAPSARRSLVGTHGLSRGAHRSWRVASRGRDSRDGGRGRASSNPAQHASWAPASGPCGRPGLGAGIWRFTPSFLRPQRRFGPRGQL